MQIFADVFGIPASRSVDGGGAASAPRSAPRPRPGSTPTSRPQPRRWPGRARSFTPDPADTEVYRRMNDTVYQAIRAATDPVLERSFPIFH